MDATVYNRTTGNCLLYHFPPNWGQPTGRNEVNDLACSCECHSHVGLGPNSHVHQYPTGGFLEHGLLGPRRSPWGLRILYFFISNSFFLGDAAAARSTFENCWVREFLTGERPLGHPVCHGSWNVVRNPCRRPWSEAAKMTPVSATGRLILLVCSCWEARCFPNTVQGWRWCRREELAHQGQPRAAWLYPYPKSKGPRVIHQILPLHEDTRLATLSAKQSFNKQNNKRPKLFSILYAR